MPFIQPEIIKMSYSNVKVKEKIGFNELAILCLSQTAFGMDIETGKNLSKIFKKYPNEYEQFKKAVQIMINQLNQLITE